MNDTPDVTQLLQKVEQGDPSAAQALMPLVYDELRRVASEKLAREKPGQTLQATALVHEAWLRLVDVDYVQQWSSRRHFFGAAAEAMRRILVDRARRRNRQRHGADWCQDAGAAETYQNSSEAVIDPITSFAQISSPAIQRGGDSVATTIGTRGPQCAVGLPETETLPAFGSD